MTSNRFFISQREVHSSRVVLEGAEHHHLSRVARIKTKEEIWLFDESGTDYRAQVEEIGKDSTRLSILEKKENKQPGLRITLAQAVIKARKMDLILQKTTELGIDAFIPVASALSVVRLNGKEEKKRNRWKRIALEAAKQCGRSFVPDILPSMPLESVLKERADSKRLFLSQGSDRFLREAVLDEFKVLQGSDITDVSVLLLVGPEGGWTEEEEQAIVNHGFEAFSLGTLVLRSETAAISSVAMISHFWKA